MLDKLLVIKEETNVLVVRRRDGLKENFGSNWINVGVDPSGPRT